MRKIWTAIAFRFHLSHRARHRLRWAFMHTAVFIFFCDIFADFIEPFHDWWMAHSHIWVALAAFLAAIAEYLNEEHIHVRGDSHDGRGTAESIRDTHSDAA